MSFPRRGLRFVRLAHDLFGIEYFGRRVLHDHQLKICPDLIYRRQFAGGIIRPPATFVFRQQRRVAVRTCVKHYTLSLHSQCAFA
jgi:hypothetical protein